MSQTRLLSLLATLIAVPVSAQGGTACLQGRVYGAAGSPLLGARVLLLNTGAAVATDIEGRFAFPELRPDTVSVRVTYIGYRVAWSRGAAIVGRPNCATGLHPRGVEGDHLGDRGATTGDGR
ncbi:MAG: carboxypeptidase regulatory-like domain-containing protein [Gemmatimonadetes bacterium]|nr:carboxypeptidase regulatory-like domain-containing protein [Gemmatimonadota bacterium]